MKKFLIIYPGALGDILLTRPILFYLKKQFPKCKIDYVGNPEYLQLLKKELNKIYGFYSIKILSLFSQQPELNVECGNWLGTYDYIIFWSTFIDQLVKTKLDTLKNTKFIYQSIKPPANYGKHQTYFSLKSLKPLGFSHPKSFGEIIHNLVISNKHQKENIICIHPGSGSKGKNLPLETYIQINTKLREKTGFRTILTLGPADKHYLKELQNDQTEFIFSQNVIELKDILSKSKYYIGNDSGVTHLAAQLGIPTLAIFVSTNPIVWSPVGKKVFVVHAQKEIESKFHFIKKLTSQKIAAYFLEHVFTD